MSEGSHGSERVSEKVGISAEKVAEARMDARISENNREGQSGIR
jgi:hypothetical protein